MDQAHSGGFFNLGCFHNSFKDLENGPTIHVLKSGQIPPVMDALDKLLYDKECKFEELDLHDMRWAMITCPIKAEKLRFNKLFEIKHARYTHIEVSVSYSEEGFDFLLGEKQEAGYYCNIQPVICNGKSGQIPRNGQHIFSTMGEGKRYRLSPSKRFNSKALFNQFSEIVNQIEQKSGDFFNHFEAVLRQQRDQPPVH